jgi:hypothetical protein
LVGVVIARLLQHFFYGEDAVCFGGELSVSHFLIIRYYKFKIRVYWFGKMGQVQMDVNQRKLF